VDEIGDDGSDDEEGDDDEKEGDDEDADVDAHDDDGDNDIEHALLQYSAKDLFLIESSFDVIISIREYSYDGLRLCRSSS
jgi:hypothetical protein